MEYLNSYAVVYLDGAKVGEMRFPGGEVDLTAACRPGQKQVLSMLVVALPLKAVHDVFQRHRRRAAGGGPSASGGDSAAMCTW